ncbi:hypothetical protein D3C78_1010090 [compost metagenome]
MWPVGLKAHRLTAGQVVPLAVNRQFQFTADDNHVLNHSGLMGRRLAERAWRQIDNEHVKTQLPVERKQRHHPHIGVALIEHRSIAVAM